MNLEEALKTIEVLKKENKRLQSRVDYFEKVVYNENEMEEYDEEFLLGFDDSFCD